MTYLDMMQKTGKELLLSTIKSHFFWTFVVFCVWLTFFDEYNLIRRSNDSEKLDQLKSDVLYYKQKIRDDKTTLNNLTSNKESLEKYAREQYLMKKKDEDIFIIIEKNN